MANQELDENVRNVVQSIQDGVRTRAELEACGCGICKAALKYFDELEALRKGAH